MWGDELEMIFKTMANMKPKSYFEWGAGGSTRWFSAFASELVVSVDNFEPWCQKVANDPFVKCLAENGVFKQGCTSPTDGKQNQVGFGTMIDSTESERVGKEFINYIDTFSKPEGIKRYDVILVDGRFRQACALKALHYLDENSILVIHDFWSRWEKYAFIMNYYDAVGRSRTIGALRKKPLEELPSGWESAYEKYSTLAYQK